MGYGAPYLDRFRDGARRCLALMPAEQGAAVWPEAGRCATALVDAQMLPLPDGCIDRLLLAHALEAADRPDLLLSEALRLGADRALGAQMGEAGRRYRDELLSEESALNRHEQWIIDLADVRQASCRRGRN